MRIAPLLILLIIVIGGVGIFGAYVWLNWTINQFMYSSKAGADWFGIVFYNGMTFVVASLLALLFLNPIPGRSDIFDAANAIIGSASPNARPMTLKPSILLWAFWQFAKWVLAFATFVNSNGIPGLGNLAMAVSMMRGGFGDWGIVPKIFLSPIDPLGSEEIVAVMPTMEIQYKIFHDVVILVLAILSLRLFLNFVKNIVRAQVGTALRSLFLSLSCIVAALLPGVAYWAMDVTTPFAFLALSTIFVCLVAASIVSRIGGQGRETFTKGRRGVAIVAAIGLLVMLLANMGVIGWYRLNWNNNWTQYEWQPLIRKQIGVTRWAAGTGEVQVSPLENLPAGNISMILSLVRQWDRDAAFTKMKNQIGVNWMTLSDAYIVYINGREYWVGPTTVLYPSDDWISHHLIYTHASRIIVMDSHTGDYVSLNDAFGIPNEPHIYYGVGLSDNVYVHVSGFSEIENSTYVGMPDYVLSGWQRTLWFAATGQFGFAFGPPQENIEMLYNRDPFERVRGILISGLDMDPAAYLVTDGERLYAVVQVYIDYRLQSGFAASNYLRFFGVVLTDIENGEMQAYVVASPKPEDFLTEFYRSYYGWKPPPDWLVPQLRYPEQLLGTQEVPMGQLDVDFRYHIDDPFIWRSGSDFYERPTATEVLYILHTIGNRAYFVGLQLVEYEASPGKNLAGLYLIYGGSRLGEIQLFRATPLANITTQLIGPSAALQALETDDYVRTQLTLLTNSRLGNILLYSIGGELYYFIPVYITTTVEGGVITKSAFISVVDATTGTKVATGQDSLSAYYALTGGIPVTGLQQRLQRIADLISSQGLALIRPKSIMANVEVNVDQTSYIAEGDWENASDVLMQFIAYAKSRGADSIYYWEVDGNDIGLGVLFSDRGVVNLYYITVRYR